MVDRPRNTARGSGWRVGALFAGIGGLELGFRRAGLVTGRLKLVCEKDPGAVQVLRAHCELAHGSLLEDVNNLTPGHVEGLDLLTAGFPCQDLSQAGRTEGIGGAKSGLVDPVLKALDGLEGTGLGPRWILIENVSFMLRLQGGRAMEYLIGRLEEAGYRRWAYRVLDTLGFGLPQRRKRVFFLASREPEDDPAGVLFDGPRTRTREDDVTFADSQAVGFYWTEGNRGIGWALEAVPTLKGGSGLGIPSPPAIWRRAQGDFVVPTLEFAERLQGFPRGWTESACLADGIRGSHRWRYIGNAVSVPVAQWVGKRLLESPRSQDFQDAQKASPPWPDAACSDANGMPRVVPQSPWPSRLSKRDRLSDWLRDDLVEVLSHKAASGFYSRLRHAKMAGRLSPMPEFMQALGAYTKNRERVRG